MVTEKEWKSAWTSKCRTFKVRGSFPTAGTRKTGNETIRSDLREKKVSKEKVKETSAWKAFIRKCPTHARMENNNIVILHKIINKKRCFSNNYKTIHNCVSDCFCLANFKNPQLWFC